MVQFYVLSVLVNLAAGMLVSAGMLESKFTWLEGLESATASSRFRIGVGAFVIGVLKILSVMNGDVPVVGDLLPAAAGLVLGGALVVERYGERTDVKSPALERFSGFMENYRNTIGIAGIAISVIHFLFPRVLFL